MPAALTRVVGKASKPSRRARAASPARCAVPLPFECHRDGYTRVWQAGREARALPAVGLNDDCAKCLQGRVGCSRQRLCCRGEGRTARRGIARGGAQWGQNLATAGIVCVQLTPKR
jgi:hypothetical protein